jgi:hypothetical protein
MAQIPEPLRDRLCTSTSTARERGNHAARYSVSDGRTALGIVKLSDGVFTSITTSGAVVGTFPTLQEAARALPDGGAS